MWVTKENFNRFKATNPKRFMFNQYDLLVIYSVIYCGQGRPGARRPGKIHGQVARQFFPGRPGTWPNFFEILHNLHEKYARRGKNTCIDS